MAVDKDKAKLVRLVEKLRELQAQTYEVTEEIQRILAGETSIGDILKDLYAAFSDLWQQRYRTPYVFDFKKDAPNMKRLVIKMRLTPADIKARMARYLATDDQYLLRQRHPFGLFHHGINSYAGTAAPAPDLELDGDDEFECGHKPRCRDAGEHTRLRMRELREPRA